MFQVNFYKLIVRLLPEWLRFNAILILLKGWIWPLIQIYEQFLLFRDSKLYRLKHNSQVCYYQKALNDRFDSIQRRIQIIDFGGQDRIYFWSDAAKQDVYFDTHYFWPDSAYLDSGVDYTILLPVDVAVTNSDYQHLIALINEYRFVGKSFNIQRL